ncbi:MAG: DUF3579 domain-containing protein [Proteobacteria bacterium]|nr:DUF3579 domain-containing protein [Pseudomonadota bacterium]
MTITGYRLTPSGSRHESFVIVGRTMAGGHFRPSDWAERLCSIMSTFGAEHRMAYSPYVQPGDLMGVKCVFVNFRLHDLEPMAFHFLESFAKDNDLGVIAPWQPGTLPPADSTLQSPVPALSLTPPAAG